MRISAIIWFVKQLILVVFPGFVKLRLCLWVVLVSHLMSKCWRGQQRHCPPARDKSNLVSGLAFIVHPQRMSMRRTDKALEVPTNSLHNFTSEWFHAGPRLGLAVDNGHKLDPTTPTRDIIFPSSKFYHEFISLLSSLSDPFIPFNHVPDRSHQPSPPDPIAIRHYHCFFLICHHFF